MYLRPSQMFGFKAGPLSNTRKHSGAQFFAVVKGPGKRIGEVLVTKFNVGAFLGRFCPNRWREALCIRGGPECWATCSRDGGLKLDGVWGLGTRLLYIVRYGS